MTTLSHYNQTLMSDQVNEPPRRVRKTSSGGGHFISKFNSTRNAKTSFPPLCFKEGLSEFKRGLGSTKAEDVVLGYFQYEVYLQCVALRTFDQHVVHEAQHSANDFLQPLLVQYLRESPMCKEIMDAWTGAAEEVLVSTAAINALAAVLECNNYPLTSALSPPIALEVQHSIVN